MQEFNEQFLTVAQAAQRLDVSERTIQRWLNEGRLPGSFKVGRSWVIPSDALDKLDAPSKVGWPEGVKRCPVCRGALTDDHECPGPSDQVASG